MSLLWAALGLPFFCKNFSFRKRSNTNVRFRLWLFNALKYTELLKGADFTRDQAEKIIYVLVEIMDQNLATKHDLIELKSELNTKFVEVNHKIENVESNLTIKLGALLTVGIGIIGAIVKLS